ncbi:MAG: carboxymuconolactone decarboxylase family protein [Nocardiopsaceae bacterium]|nr:carboxymuconolactone decarboxylase family protein [Nocardiopsaceae bacterium]
MASNDGVRARVALVKELPQVYEALVGLNSLTTEILGERLCELVKLRASYLNGCAFCIDMHTREAIEMGEDQRRLFTLAAWREAANHFTEAERAALALVDEVTKLGEHGVSDEVYANAAEHYSDRQMAALITAIGVINVFNRIGITTGMQPPNLR